MLKKRPPLLKTIVLSRLMAITTAVFGLAAASPLAMASPLAISTPLAQAQPVNKPEPTQPSEPVANSNLNADTFYGILLGELNLIDGEPRAAFAFMLNAARKTKHPELFERAVSIALQARSGDSALAAARAWLLAIPTSVDAARYLVQVSVNMNRLEQAAGKADMSIALEVAKIALANKPSDAEAVELALELMRTKSAAAEQLVKQYLSSTTFQPKPEIRLAYSRALMTESRFDEAMAQAKKLSIDSPTFAPGWLVLGTLHYQNALEAQEINEKTGKSDKLAEAKASNASAQAALKTYIQLTDALPAQQKAANQQRAYVLLANIAKNSKQYQQAYDMLSKALAQLQDSNDDSKADLQYELAMMAEKLGKFNDMERILRQVIQDKPQDAQAYNALGYSMADRNTRLPEAKVLIQKAVQLAPQDPFIADSLGWVEFRMGNAAEAIRILEAAYKSKPDAEIAAHLGEVLWKQGMKERATAVWKEGVSLNKNNDTLLETLKRLGIRL